MKIAIRRRIRQAARGTLRVCPGHNNDSVFQVFGNSLRKELKHPEALSRLRYGVGNTNVERLAAEFFIALKAGEFQVLTLTANDPEDVVTKIFSPSSAVRCYKIRGKVFRRTVGSTADAERVLEELGIKFIRETGGPLSKKELKEAFRLLNPPSGSKEWFIPKLL